MSRPLERRIVETIVRLRGLVLALVLSITALAGWQASRVGFDSSIESWFLQNDPDLVTYHEFLERFGGDELTVIGVFADDLFTADRLQRLHSMATEAEGAPWVLRVRSLSNFPTLRDVDGALSVAPLMASPPASDAEARRLRELALADPIIAGNLVTPNGDGTAIVVEIDPRGNSFEAKMEQVQALRAIVERHRGDMTVWIVGSPPVDEALLQRTAEDYRLLTPVMALVIIAMFLGLFRRLSATLIGLSVVGLANLWLLGLMGALGIDITIISSALAAMILAVGVAQGVHVINAYYRRVARGEAPQQAVITCTSNLLLPLFFTAATTAAGFLSLLISDLKPIAQLGMLASIGVVLSFMLTLCIMPILLPYSAAPDAGYLERQRRGVLTGVARYIGHMSRRTAGLVLGVCLLLAGLSLYEARHIPVGANVMNYFLPDDPMRVQQEEVDRRLGGSANLEFLVEAPDGGLADPQVLARMLELERWLETLPGVTRSMSAADLLSLLNQRLAGLDEPTLPDSPELAAQLYLLLEGDGDLEAFVQDDASVGRISARAQISAARELTQRIDDIEARLAERYNDEDLKVSFTGYWKLVSEMEVYLVKSQIESFLIAFVAISLMMFLLLRSVWLGLLAMIPNLLPIVLGLGVMAALDIALDPGTAMIGCIALGLVVDDTVHLLVHLRRHIADGMEMDAAVQASLEEVGPAIVMTSVILALGFAVLMLANFTPNRSFGLVAAIVVVLALAADLIVLPAALKVLRPRLGRAKG